MDWNQPTNPAAGRQAHDSWAFPGSFGGHPGRGTDHVNLHAPFPFRFGPGDDDIAFGPQGPGGPRDRRGSCRGDECSSDEESHPSDASPGPDAKTAAVPEAERGATMEGLEPAGEKGGSPDTLRDPAEREKADGKPGEKPAGGPRGCRHGRHHHHQHGPRGPHGPHGPQDHGHPGPGGPFGGPFGGHFGGPFHGPPFGGRGRSGRWFGRRGGFGFGFGPDEMQAAFGRGAEPRQAFQQAFAAAALAAHQQVGKYIQSMGGRNGPSDASMAAATGEDDAGARNMDGGDDDDDVEYFTPPVDIFETEAGPSGAWVVHVAVPGAKKDDIGIHWQAERGVLSISGVVYRPGDEAFQRGLVSSERKTGLFKREVRLPPPSSASTGKEDVDAKGISARLEDGVLSISVPRMEKEWTEVLKVDII